MKKFEKADPAVFFYKFTLWLTETALAEGISKLYFFTREGEFLKSLYDEAAKMWFPGKKLPAAEVLEVSRMSTFLPSCTKISLEECMRIWNQYETQSMSALLKSFYIKPGRMQQYFAKYKIDANEKIQKPWTDKRVQALFQDQAFIQAVTQEKEAKKRLLCSYLEEKGFCEQEGSSQKKSGAETAGNIQNKKIGIVDIGWRGTIQDNLCYIYPDYEIVGFYMGLQPFLSPQPVNSKKYGYINQSSLCDQILMFITPIEMLCNSPNGSTVSYQEQDGHIQAVKRKDKQENAVFFQYTQARQHKIAAYMRTYCRLAAKRQEKTNQTETRQGRIIRHSSRQDRTSYPSSKSRQDGNQRPSSKSRQDGNQRPSSKSKDRTSYSSSKSRQDRNQRPSSKSRQNRNKLAYWAIYRFVAWPDRQTANAYFSLKHDETFGMGCCLDKRKTPGLKKLFAMLPLFYKKEVWIAFLKQTTWPQGYFVKYRLYPLLAAYNAMLLYDTLKKQKRGDKKTREQT